ncbi:MAG: solute carrier family 23 protein, partial [Caldilinea sp.]
MATVSDDGALAAAAVMTPPHGVVLYVADNVEPAPPLYLIAADLFTCGIATLLQVVGTRWFGIRLPVVLGCTFTAVGPIIAISMTSNLATAYGSIIVAGLAVFLLAPLFGKLLRFFPTVVTGSVVTIIGLSLIPVALFNPATAEFQFVERAAWLGGVITYRMGVDGISLPLVVLT